MAEKFSELEGMTREELVDRYDRMSTNVSLGLDFVRQEIARRDQDAATRLMLSLTNRIWWATAVVTVATLVNVGVFIATVK